MNMVKEFGFSIGLTIICLIGAFWYGFQTGGLANAFSFFLIAVILGVMEVSLSFDNAVVNAKVLSKMDPIWQRRFLTWGILIAVFGMRFIFPIAIVAVIANLGFVEVLQLALNNSSEYAKRLHEAHIPISAFGGAFLMLVFLKYIMDPEKNVHWLNIIEKPLAKAGKLESVQLMITAILLISLVNTVVPEHERYIALFAGFIGILVYVGIEALSSLFDADNIVKNASTAGLVSFIYLEILDASFSLDGVIGAFAITKEIVIIAAGLCIGAVFVRSLTLLLMKKNTLKAYIYLEHGAHYGIGALALIMLLSLSPDIHIPELVTGLIGVAFIALAVWFSIIEKRKNPDAA